ncbi:MAG: hypothetical protein C4519_00760 [Desulfobacteraceae bacterium]|nr:MAG: hypothetical protein C4519_00760 [Desulfobacteraceae bacterium]
MSQHATGTKDKDYNLISVLYHALSGAHSCIQFQEDAKRENDDQVVKFMAEAQEQYRALAEKAKQLLGTRL